MRGMNIAAWLARNAHSFGDRPAISQGHTAHSTSRQWAAHADDLPHLDRVVVTGESEWRQWLGGDGVTLVQRRPEDPAWLFYTSGTTGRPKGATLTNRNLIAASFGYFSDVDPIAPTDAK